MARTHMLEQATKSWLFGAGYLPLGGAPDPKGSALRLAQASGKLGQFLLSAWSTTEGG